MSSTALTADPRYYGENWRYAALAKIILALLATLDTENTP